MEDNTPAIATSSTAPEIFQAEVSSVDLGGDALEEIEDIVFFHSYSKLRLFSLMKPPSPKQPIFNYLLTNEFTSSLEIQETDIKTIKADYLLSLIKPKLAQYFDETKETNFKTMFIFNLPSHAETIGFDSTLAFLIPIIKDLTVRPKEVLLAFLNSTRKLFEFLLKHDRGYNVIMNHIIPVVNDIVSLHSKSENILKHAAQTYEHVASFATDDDKAALILPTLIILAHNNECTHGQLISLEIFNEIAPKLGPDACEAYVIPQLQSFIEDPKDKIRMATVQNMIHICECVSAECLKEKMLPIYKKLSADNHWPIRKASCEILPSLAKIATADLIENELIQIYVNFTKDNEGNIKNTALGIFGEFIYCIPQDALTKHESVLFDFYVNYLTKIYKKKSYELDTTPFYKCAYNFPSVVQVYAKTKWPQLKQIYDKFINDKEYRIKVTISSSFAVISKLIGPENSEKDIAPIIMSFFKNHGFAIKIAIINILPEYICTIENADIKAQFLECFEKMSDETKKWRSKKEYVLVIGKLSSVYCDETIVNKLLPVIVPLCFHTVHEVRVKAVKQLAKLCIKLLQSGNEEYKKKCTMIIENFAMCVHYHYRQLFLHVCKKFFKHEQLFKEFLYEMFVDLAFDKVVNVRFTYAKILKKAINKVEWMKQDDNVQGIVKMFKEQRESRVLREMMEHVEVKEGVNAIEKRYNVNAKFIQKMELIVQMFKFTPMSLGNSLWLKDEKKNNNKEEHKEETINTSSNNNNA